MAISKMKKIFTLSVAAVFFCMISVTGQEAQEMIQGGENTEVVQSADELFPYVPKLRTNIDSKDYKVSLERAGKIIKLAEKAFLPDKKTRKTYTNALIKDLEDKYRSKDKDSSDEDFIKNCIKDVLDGFNSKIKDAPGKLEEKVAELKIVPTATPAGTPEEATRAKAREAVKKQVEREFTEADKEITDKLTREAKNKYPLYKKGDKVTITYSSGRNHYRVTGIFHGHGIGGRSVIINSHSIPKRNLSREVKARFDKKENEKLAKYLVAVIV